MTEVTALEAVYRTIAREIDEIEDTRNRVEISKFIQEAEGQQLDWWGERFEVERFTGESDGMYRIRIMARFRSMLSSGTLRQINDIIDVLLSDPTFDLSEPDNESALVEVTMLDEAFDEEELDADDFFDELRTVTAVGVDIRGVLEGTFEFGDGTTTVVDDERGFSELDADGNPKDNIGGRWTSFR